jgi:beta-glucosidase-like glycosyl hydrolase
MKKLVLIVLAAGVMLCGGTLLAQDYLGMPFMDSGRPVAERVEDLLERLTLEEGLITETQLDVSLGRLLKARFELGMFDPADKVPWSQIPYNIVASPLHAEQALLMARKSMTLLKKQQQCTAFR